MKKSIIYLLIISLVGSVAMSSCEDMLESDSERHSYETAQDTLYAYWGVLKSLQNIGERYVLLGELRGDLVMPGNLLDPDAEVSDSLRNIARFTNLEDGACRYLAARDYYAVINNCNAYIAAADTNRIVYGGTSNNSRYMLREYAQVEAIRAWVYLQLVELYKEVPFYLQPLTSTDAINDFINNPNYEKVDRNTLPEKIGARLLPLIAKQANHELADPQYGYYSGSCHSSYCLFPLRLVMGDIYLNADRYEEAATQYHAWMRDDDYTAVPFISYNCAMPSILRDKVDYDVSQYYSTFYANSSEVRGEDVESEAITVIPATTNKLWGNVLRGVNEAFGYTAEVLVSTSTVGTDTASMSGYISLTPITYKRQFVASKEFGRVTAEYPCLSINSSKQAGMKEGEIAYDYFTTTGTDPDTARDCRYGWFAKTSAETANGNYCRDSCFITKQNPRAHYTNGGYSLIGTFSTTYPVIYRRALVWLRFAEAINRAGYPEYAYAVLKDGCFGGVLPIESLAEVLVLNETLTCIRTTIKTPQTDENGEPLEDLVTSKCEIIKKDSKDSYTLINDGTITQEFIYPSVVFTCDLDTYREFIEGGDEAQELQIADTLSISLDVYKTYVDATKTPELRNSNRSSTSAFALTSGDYIPVNQLHAANYVPWLDFSSINFNAASMNSFRLGIHQRGSNYEARAYCEDTLYNFDKCVAAKWPGKKLGSKFPGRLNYYTVDGGTYAEYKKNLIEAVEELIIDELALECCFEGNRYTDLVRFANRDNRGITWLQDKINKRTMNDRGEIEDPVTISNMYLPLPQ